MASPGSNAMAGEAAYWEPSVGHRTMLHISSLTATHTIAVFIPDAHANQRP